MKTMILTAFAAVFSIGLFAQAGPGHQPKHLVHHPRVNEVNSRIDNQEKRITTDRKDGDITHAEAKADRTDLTEINKEKRNMRKTDNGHITRADKRALNQQLNQNSKTIKKQ